MASPMMKALVSTAALYSRAAMVSTLFMCLP
jgi:hypothetical protein